MTKVIRAKIMSSSVETKTLYNLIMSFPGIGFYKTKKILTQLGFPIHTIKQRVKDLSKSYKEKLYKLIVKEVEKSSKPKHKLLTIKTYKNYRYIYNLPLRGQRTKTNAQTQKKLKKKNDRSRKIK